MNIFELEKKFDVVTDGKDASEKDAVAYKLYDESFKIIRLPSDEILAIIRKFDDMVTREENGVKYLDKSLREMVTTVAFFSQCTDLDTNRPVEGKDGEADMVAVYDIIKKLDLVSYLYERDYALMSIFENFRYLEEEVFFDKHRFVNTSINVSGGKG